MVAVAIVGILAMCGHHSRGDQVEVIEVGSRLVALGGALIGVLGTVLTELVRGRRDDQKIWREELRSVCAEFANALSRLHNLSHELSSAPNNPEVQRAAQDAHSEMRGLQDRLRFTSKSISTQEAARRLQHYCYYEWKSTQGGKGDLWQIHKEILPWLAKFYVAARAELGLEGSPIYQELPEGFPIPGYKGQVGDKA